VVCSHVAFRKTSLVDFPGRVAAVFFFPGCSLRCPWCQNRDLVLGGGADLIPLEEAFSHVEKRRKVLGGVVLSGGEPTLRPDLPQIIERLKALGLPVKLDTNGMAPAVLSKLFENPNTRPDYVALDLKLATERYGCLRPGCPPEQARQFAANLRESAALISSSGVPHEYRSLVLPENFFGPADVEALAPLVDGSPWHFRLFRPGSCLDPAWNAVMPYTDAETERLIAIAQETIPGAALR